MDIDFNSDHADSILEHCQNSDMNEMEAWLHLIVAAASLCPKKEMSRTVIELVYDEIESENPTNGESNNMKVKLEFELTSDEHRYLVKMLKQEKQNLSEDLSGSDYVDISETAIRLLNDDSNIVDSMLKKLGH